MTHTNLRAAPLCYSPHLLDHAGARPSPSAPFVIGVLEGEGVGQDVVDEALRVLSAVTAVTGRQFEVRRGRDRGIDADNGYVVPLNPATETLCRETFSAGGAILAGPGGGRFVYRLRREFDLYCKLVPVVPFPELAGVTRIRETHLADVDIMIIRENISGIYFGDIAEHEGEDGRRIDYTFSYTEQQVRRIIRAAARIAARRRKRLTMVSKDGGLPGISDLWRACAEDIAAEEGVSLEILLIDYAAYYMIQHAAHLDVVVASNLFGDILADVSAVLMGSRGLSFSGNFSGTGAGVYQTNHGAARDLVGTDQANPVAQILTAAMMLRESFGLAYEAHLVERAVAKVFQDGYRTPDLMQPGCNKVGTRELGQRVADAVALVAATTIEE